MMRAPDNQRIADELNELSLSIAKQAVSSIEAMQMRMPPLIALDIQVQALLTAAVSLLKTGQTIGLPVDPEAAARRGIERVLTLQVKFHERRPDGTFGPGQPYN